MGEYSAATTKWTNTEAHQPPDDGEALLLARMRVTGGA
jgi:hypothetical protein